MRSEDVRKALARKFCSPEYALFYEVGNATGGRQTRWADAVAMGLWPSRGLHLTGFEIKVARSDWLNEMRNPAKAEAIAQYCHFWYIVTPPGIVKEGELPEQWGLYEVKANGLHCARKAPLLPDRTAIDMSFLAALLRRSDEHAKASVREAVDKAMVDERAALEKRLLETEERLRREAKERDHGAAASLAKVQEACGLPLDRYFDADGFAKAVGLVHRLGVAGTYSALKGAASTARKFAETFSAVANDAEAA